MRFNSQYVSSLGINVSITGMSGESGRGDCSPAVDPAGIRRDGGRQGDGSFVLSWAFILDSIACSTALSVKVKPSGWQPLIDGLILVGSRSVVAAYFTL